MNTGVPPAGADAMSRTPRIADSEWKVMKILWAHKEPQPAYDIVQELLKKENWQPKTVKTLLGRLVQKGALGYRKYKNLYLYYPLVTESACVKAEGESFLDRCFDGALQPMLAHFVRTRKLSPAEIRELKRLLAEKEE
jgi:BlaI family transcriptional regulator, penicillinase repressor